MLRKLCIALLAVFLCVQQVSAAETGNPMPCIERIITAYRFTQEGKDEKIRQALTELETVNPRQAAIWHQIVEKWYETDGDMEVSADVLPDGLPQDNSLCIVVMGFRLEDNGIMKPELLQRLQTALNSARKYPEALIICTGGSTARNARTTEADAMKAWLVEQGVEEDRIVAETRAYTSMDNARYTYQTLRENYPEVTTLSLVTSDYHLPRITMIFTAVGLYDMPEGACCLRGNAVCVTGRTGNNEKNQTADNLLQIARESLTRPIPEPPETTAPETTVPETTVPETQETVMPTQAREPAARTENPPTEVAETIPEAPRRTPEIPRWVPSAMGTMLLLEALLLVLLIKILRRR